MQARAVDELFAEYADALARGERPRAVEYLERAGPDADALATVSLRDLPQLALEQSSTGYGGASWP